MRKAQVNRDAAALLFFQPVGVDAGQRFDQRGLTMVDVPRRTDNNVLHICGKYQCHMGRVVL